MTKTTLKALWVGGGGIVATWLAVSPAPTTPASTSPSIPPEAVETRPAQALDLASQTDELRKRERPAELKSATRNPFRFGAPRAEVRNDVREGSAPKIESLPPPPPAPTLMLSGIAEKQTDSGPRRLAVIATDSKLYVAGEGEVIEGRYTIVAIDREAVLLRDFAGGELRLILRP